MGCPFFVLYFQKLMGFSTVIQKVCIVLCTSILLDSPCVSIFRNATKVSWIYKINYITTYAGLVIAFLSSKTLCQ